MNVSCLSADEISYMIFLSLSWKIPNKYQDQAVNGSCLSADEIFYMIFLSLSWKIPAIIPGSDHERG
jgi:hypothetical protein